MSYAAKHRIVVVLLAVLAIWPLAHRVLVPAFDLSPWKLFGWAMYCVPGRLIAVKVVPERTGVPLRLPALDEQPEGLRNAHIWFDEMRRARGRYIHPDRYALALREVYANIGPIEIVITEAELDRETARLEQTSKKSYRYDGEGRPVE